MRVRSRGSIGLISILRRADCMWVNRWERVIRAEYVYSLYKEMKLFTKTITPLVMP